MTELLLKADGLAFGKQKYDLRAVDAIVSNYTRLIDRSVPILLGQKNITPDLRDRLRYEVQIKPGSLKILLELIINHKEDIASMLIADPVNMTSALAKIITEVVEFRRKFAEFIEKGLKPKVIINSGTFIDASNNSGTIIINDPRTIIAAESTRTALDGLVKGVDGKQIEDVSLTHKNVKTTKITHDDIKITGSRKEELPSSIQIVGRLDMVSFSTHRGRIISGTNKYHVKWDDNIRVKLQKCADVDGVLFTARPVIDHRRVGDNTIGFHLLDCHSQQESLFK